MPKSPDLLRLSFWIAPSKSRMFTERSAVDSSASFPCALTYCLIAAIDGRVRDGGQLRPGVALGHVGELRDVDVLGERLLLRVDLEYLYPALLVGRRGPRSSLSNLPGLSSASSMMSGLFVAPEDHDPLQLLEPVHLRQELAHDALRHLAVASRPTSVLGAIASISSKKMTQGAAARAFLKTSLTPFSDSPTHFEMSSGPLMLMKFASLSFATALAMRVFPVPGGP